MGEISAKKAKKAEEEDEVFFRENDKHNGGGDSSNPIQVCRCLIKKNSDFLTTVNF